VLRRVADSRSVFRRWVQRRFRLVGDSSTGPRPYPGGVGASRCNGPLEESFQSPVRERLVDVAIAVALAALAVSEALTDDPSVAYVFPEPNGWLVLLTLLGSLPLAFRRVRPFAVLTAVLAATVAVSALRWDTGSLPACVGFALYTVAAWTPRRVAVSGLVMVWAATALLALVRAPFFDHPLALISVVAFAIVFAVGRVMRRTREGREAALARALEAERAQAALAERALLAERLRIARELHDVISHTLSVIAVQSGVARHLLGDDPWRVGPALTAIENASREALDDLRRMLGVLRAESLATGEARLSPSPGLQELDQLALAHRASSGTLDVWVDPAVASVPDSVRLTIYRVVQEALTNVRKHAPGAHASVTVRSQQGRVVVEVYDDGRVRSDAPTPPLGTGHGLAGMRERVGLYGGTVEAQPRPEGGFRVRAVLDGDVGSGSR